MNRAKSHSFLNRKHPSFLSRLTDYVVTQWALFFPTLEYLFSGSAKRTHGNCHQRNLMGWFFVFSFMLQYFLLKWTNLFSIIDAFWNIEFLIYRRIFLFSGCCHQFIIKMMFLFQILYKLSFETITLFTCNIIDFWPMVFNSLL